MMMVMICRVFTTSDSDHLLQMREWSEKASSLVDNSTISQSPFGQVDSDGFIHVTKEQFMGLHNEVQGSLGEFFRTGKNMFTRCGIITNHVISSFSSIPETYPNFDGVHILSRILSSSFLLKHVREEGGAYGVTNVHGNKRNLFSSYDDPNVLRTVDQFVKGCEWIEQKQYSTKDIQEARLSLFSDMDAPSMPQQLGYGEVFSGKTSEKRQIQREQLLTLSEEALHEVGKQAYHCDPTQMTTCVFGNAKSQEEIEKDPNWIIDELPLQCYVCCDTLVLLMVIRYRSGSKANLYLFTSLTVIKQTGEKDDKSNLFRRFLRRNLLQFFFI